MGRGAPLTQEEWSFGHAWVLPLLSLLDAVLLGFAEVATFGLPQRLLILPWELFGHGTRLPTWASEPWNVNTALLPARLSASPPIRGPKVVSRCGGLALCGSLVFLLGNLTHPVWCAPDGASILNSGFLGLHNCIIGGYWVHCYLMWKWKSKRVGFLVLFCFQNISLVALRVGFFGFKIESGKVKIKWKKGSQMK